MLKEILEKIKLSQDSTQQTDQNPFPLFVELFDALRPIHRSADSHLSALVLLLENETELAAGLRSALLQIFSQRHAVLLLATSGIYPATGVLAETLRRISHRLLPEVDAETQLKDGLRVLLKRSDARWIANSRREDWIRLANLLGFMSEHAASEIHAGAKSLLEDVLEALRIVAHRIAAAGLESEMLRLDPELENHVSPFLGVCEEALALAAQIEAQMNITHPIDALGKQSEIDERHLEVLIDQAFATIERLRRRAQQQGASFYLTFHLRRLDQHLHRLRRLVCVIACYARKEEGDCLEHTVELWRELAVAECQQNNIRQFWRQNAELVALRVTENAGRSGEHYITETRSEYFAMLKAAAGGGCAVAFVAAMKINIAARGLAPLAEVLANCLNYGLGFVLIHLLHFSVATKQPAMTANAIAAAIGEIQGTGREKQRNLEPLIGLVARTVRTQIAAIIGNIGLAIPVAFCIAYLVHYFSGSHFVTPAKAKHLLQDIELFQFSTLLYAAVAGVCLFLAGLIAGYYDNLCSYSRIPERLNRLMWPQKLFGQQRWYRTCEYIRNNLGVLAGNFFLGFLLGGAAGLGTLLGLPIDVRHTTLSSAMWSYSIFALDFKLPWHVFVSTALGFLAIGVINLGVSFYLAMSVALRARGVDFRQKLRFIGNLFSRFRAHPREFFLPPKSD